MIITVTNNGIKEVTFEVAGMAPVVIPGRKSVDITDEDILRRLMMDSKFLEALMKQEIKTSFPPPNIEGGTE